MSTLDLSRVEGAPDKVKLLDGKLYDIADPDQLGALALQRISSRYRAAKKLMAKKNATEKDVEEMLELLVDIMDTLVPDAPRDELGRLGLPKMEMLIGHFRGASPGTAGREEATSAG